MDKPNPNRENLQAIGELLAALEENPYTPEAIQDAVHDYLCELGSVIPLWQPRVLRAVFWIMSEEAEKTGVDITRRNLVGQHIEQNPQDYTSQEAVN